MSITTQVLIAGACILVASVSYTRCYDVNVEQQRQSKTIVPYSQYAASYNAPSVHYERFSSPYGPSMHVDRTVDINKDHQQPSVYHSIIDRTSNSRVAGPLVAGSSKLGSAPKSAGDLHTAAGHHHGHTYGKYYEYRAVPKKKTWKYGYKRGNHKHTIMRHEHGNAGKHPHFKTKVKWHDKKSKGKGIHLWDYNHHDKKRYHHG